MKKIVDQGACALGEHVVLVSADALSRPTCHKHAQDYVAAEAAARTYTEEHPKSHAFVAKIVKQYHGVSHAYEVTRE